MDSTHPSNGISAGSTHREGFIPDGEYQRIVRQIPIPCVDVVVASGDRFLLGKRRIDPARGEWWPPGGRVFMGERLIDAVKRKLREDLGVYSGYTEPRFVFTGETIFRDPNGGYCKHTVNSVYLVELDESADVNFKKSGASDFSEVRWFDEIDSSWSEYVKLCLTKAGFGAG